MVRGLPSTEKIRDAIGWQARTGLDEIIEDVVATHQRVGLPA
jgi:hypothetical protein